MADNTENTVRSMPESIAKAVCQVMGKITRISKDNENKFDNYKFTSVDDFIESVNPLCADAGLFILQDESKPPEFMEKEGKSGTQRVIWFEFEFTLVSDKGDMYGPLRKSVFVPSTGAQAFGSAQSYALKQFLRSLFLIPTGDKDDPDITANKGMETAPTIDTRAMATRINRSIALTKTISDIDQISVKYNDDMLMVQSVSATAYDFLMDALQKRTDAINIAASEKNAKLLEEDESLR